MGFAAEYAGFPDNITFNSKDTYWLALYAPRSSVMEFLQARPYWRRTLKIVHLALIMLTELDARRYGFVLN